MVAVYTSETEKQVSASSVNDSELLVLDAHTFKDLDVFESDSEEASLFEFCNLTRTKGGASVLRRRMERPWSNASRIQATQEALSFIIANRQAFTHQPSAYATGRVALYTHEILPIVEHDNPFEFGVGAFGLWINHERFYSDIIRGVKITCRVIQSLKRFVGQIELALPAGELAALFEEMRALLARPRLALVPDQKTIGWAWKVLRLDQVFRLQEKISINRLLQLTHEIDALVSMADVTQENEFVMPIIEDGPLHVNAQGLVHPFVQSAVANPVNLDQQRRVLFLTGPNMAGKTTYLRAFATALYLAHLGMGVPARCFRFVPAERLFSSFSLQDDLRSGVSYFRAEALRVKAIAQAVADGYRVVALMDEPFKGTNVKDALDASFAIVQRLATKEDCLFMFSSHLIELGEQLNIVAQVDCRYFKAEENEGRLRFDYLLHQGVSSQRLGMRVLREEGIFLLLDGIQKEE